MNLRGWGELSSFNSVGAKVEVVPSQVRQPSDGELTTETQIHLLWNALASQEELGGLTCTILSYNIQWRHLNEDWLDVTGIERIHTETEYIQTLGVSSGVEYTFRIRAKNKHGWGAFSPELTILAATEPGISENTSSS